MGEKTGIAWTDHTFNPWWGCTKVSPGCHYCYAEALAKRVGQDCFGPGRSRRFFGEKHWNEPTNWNKRAASSGVRERVFCGSMCDIFEQGADDIVRSYVFGLIRRTPSLDWLLLTKRPEYMRDMLPADHLTQPWPNIWLGVTAENQEMADRRIPFLLETPAARRFVSAEPLLEAVTLHGISGLDWVIAGGESGAHHRPLNLDWVRSIRDQCAAACVPFFFKQTSGVRPESTPELDGRRWTETP